MKDLVIYVHGKCGSSEESEHFKSIFPDSDVVGFDYRSQTPWEAKAEFPPFFAERKQQGGCITLIANSIGAFFALSSLDETLVDRAYFISPVVDMAALICSMMRGAGVTERELAEKAEIPTAFGETLSWRYLTYVREHPIAWRVPTHILYGAHDDLTSLETITAFAQRHSAALTVMPDGEHWFHTPPQLRFMDAWLASEQAN